MLIVARWLRVCLPAVLAVLVATPALAADTKAAARATTEQARRVVAHGGAADADVAVSASPRLPANESPYGRDTVWVNTASGIYHRDGDPWYGKTKQGRYMTEDEAIRAGYRLSKQTETK
jgi:hypothetical protein